FSVGAVGAGPLSYQWRLNGAALAGATNAMLTVSNAGTANVGAYDVVITNAFGALTSAVATLTVQMPRPVIQTDGAGPGFSGKDFGFNISGPSGVVVVIEASTNFLDWVPVQTNGLVNGQVHIVDPQAGLLSNRFYRARFVEGSSP
ncbi:MAG TPA: hypothetical protein VNZ22_01060, partial [Bacillota bacterium]|nr:hypothetical protein [Bacillota bacterium]